MLIAKVHITAGIDGQRQTYAPGEELPKLSPRDAAELLRLGAVEDTEAAAEQAIAAADAAQQRLDEFEALKADTRRRAGPAQSQISNADLAAQGTVKKRSDP